MILLFLLVVSALSAQVKIYKGNSTYSGDCIATFSKGKLYKGNSTYSGDCVLTFTGSAAEQQIQSICCLFFRHFFLWSPFVLSRILLLPDLRIVDCRSLICNLWLFFCPASGRGRLFFRKKRGICDFFRIICNFWLAFSENGDKFRIIEFWHSTVWQQFRRDAWVAERNGLLNRRRDQTLPRVRIPLSPPFLRSNFNKISPLFPTWGCKMPIVVL